MSSERSNILYSHSEPLVIGPRAGVHQGTVIFLHGLGQLTQSWLPVVNTLSDRLPGIKWILPQAPLLPIAMNEGQLRPAWFDAFHLPPCGSCGVSGIGASVARIEHIILAEMQILSQPNRVVVAGFSQGAALSMILALTSLHDLGGVASLSGWIPRRCRQQMAQFEPNLPVFWGHGTADEEIPLVMAEECVRFLKLGLNFPEDRVTYKTYNGLDHSIGDQEINDLVQWLQDTLV